MSDDDSFSLLRILIVRLILCGFVLNVILQLKTPMCCQLSTKDILLSPDVWALLKIAHELHLPYKLIFRKYAFNINFPLLQLYQATWCDFSVSWRFSFSLAVIAATGQHPLVICWMRWVAKRHANNNVSFCWASLEGTRSILIIKWTSTGWLSVPHERMMMMIRTHMYLWHT